MGGREYGQPPYSSISASMSTMGVGWLVRPRAACGDLLQPLVTPLAGGREGALKVAVPT